MYKQMDEWEKVDWIHFLPWYQLVMTPLDLILNYKYLCWNLSIITHTTFKWNYRALEISNYWRLLYTVGDITDPSTDNWCVRACSFQRETGSLLVLIKTWHINQCQGQIILVSAAPIDPHHNQPVTFSSFHSSRYQLTHSSAHTSCEHA